MSAVIALAPLAGLVAGLTALWVDRAVTARERGKPSSTSPAIAAGLGLVTALSAWMLSQDSVLASAVMASVMAAAVAVSTDLRFGLLADLTSLIIALGALVAAPRLDPELTYAAMLMSGGLGFAILALAGLYGKLRRGQMGLGAGDLLLAGALGLWCQPLTAALGVSIGAALTLVAGVIGKARLTSRLPFGPGLIAGFLIAYALDRLS